jgi:sugar phosphate isomerase/epimerase
MVHVHISDNFGKIDPITPASHSLVYGYGDLHLPIGWGNLPYREIFELIKPTYRGIYLLVIDPQFREHYHYAIKRLRSFLGEA